MSNAILAIILKGKRELVGVYNLNSFNATVYEIASKVSSMCNVHCEDISQGQSTQIVNFKLQTKSYDFKIHSNKFIKNFQFKFNDTLLSITENLLDNWDKIENHRIFDKSEFKNKKNNYIWTLIIKKFK